MRKIHLFSFFFALVAVLCIFALYRYYISFSTTESSPTEEIVGVSDAKTGRPIPDTEKNRILAEQKKEERIFTYTGTVVSVGEGVMILKSEGYPNLSLRLRAGGTVVRIEEDDEREISLSEIIPGETVSIVFPEGATRSELWGATVFSVKSAEVYPQSLTQDGNN